MAWKCKLCSIVCDKRTQLLEHYRLHHCNLTSTSPLPCLYDDCICTFQSVNALKIHLTRVHTNSVVPSENVATCMSFVCPLCEFKQPFNEKSLLSHLRTHLKQHEMVECPFQNCHYRTNVYSSFNAHKSRSHPDCGISYYRTGVVFTENESQPVQSLDESDGCGPSPDSPELAAPDCNPSGSRDDTGELHDQLKNNLASLFLKMYSVLHVSEMAIQDIIQNLSQIFSLSKPLVREAVVKIFQEHDQSISDALLHELVEAVMKSNVFVSATSEGAELSTAKRRKTFVRSNYPLVMQVPYNIDSSGHTAVYVPILQMIQTMFKNTDLLDKIHETKPSPPESYLSHEDGTHFKENPLLSEAGDLKLSLILYVDDIELANPLGTARKIHKLCAVYWLLANVPSKYRSSLHVIQLALLCKVPDLHKCGYQIVLSPLLKDLRTLEQDGIFIESVGQCIKGTVLCVAADNLAAHGLAGFVQGFRGQYVCRFCCCSLDQIKSTEVSEGKFSMRTTASHDFHVQNVVEEEKANHMGVTGVCALSAVLQHFHPITGFPPDILHDLFEGIVPVELSLCIREMIRLKYFTLEYLNTKIRTFPYQHTDRLDKPQQIPKNFAVKLNIGGNGHENSTLLRLLPLMVGSKVPEGDETWDILMDLKEIVQLVLSPSFTEESIQYMQTKISDHRQGLQAVFPDFKLRPKHHYVEHYPEMTRRFGPLVHLWTMRFEGKHRFFKRVIHDTNNFKNVLKTLATRHQHMMAYYFSAPLFFKPHMQASSVTSVQVATLSQVAKDFIKTKTDSQTIYSTSKVSVDGTEYANGIFVSAGQAGGLPKFSRIEQTLLVNNSVSFLCRQYESWYREHLRSFELTSTDNFSVHQLSELNDTGMAAQNVLLHVHTSMDVVRKMSLSSRPESVDELKTMIKEKFKIDYDFCLSYEDPEFDGQLCSLVDIEELPQKAVLKLVRSESDASSIASDDTVILPHAMTPSRAQKWPEVFPVPTFSYEVEVILAEGNVANERTGKTLKLSRGQKHDILETLAAKMHSYKAYPNDKEISVVAEALVSRYPCLKEPGSQTGWYGWKNSLKFKMGNFRSKLSRAGVREVAVNSGKRSRNDPHKQAPHTNIKRPKRAEINFLPNFPRGEDSASLEQQRLQIADEVMKTEKNLPLIEKLMQSTFALRRQEIINDDLPLGEILDRWPALKLESQICSEFLRITNINLKNHFYAEFDRHVPRLQSLFRKKAARTGKIAEVLGPLFRSYDLQEQLDVNVRRAVVLRALPTYLHEDDSAFLKQWDVAQPDEPQIGNVPVGLLLINASSADAMVLCPDKVAIVLEGNVVVDCPTLADAFLMLFALIYALHLSYPKDLANTFDFIQKVLMGLEDGKLRPRVLSLKNDLLSPE